MSRGRPLNAPKALQDIRPKDRLRLFRAYETMVNGHARDKRRCVLWQGRYQDPKAYGQIRANGEVMWVHRAIYALFVGPIPAGMTVHHKCSNPSCVNPRHLELKTIADNTAEGNSRRHTKNDLPI